MNEPRSFEPGFGPVDRIHQTIAEAVGAALGWPEGMSIGRERELPVHAIPGPAWPLDRGLVS